MAIVLDHVIENTLRKMTARIARKVQSGSVANEQSGLLYLGNKHDAIPRQLFLDHRLSPLDKMAWVMIRLYAEQNDGAVFPTYEELQLQLASPHSGKASRETVSRTLLMLRLTGWLSLCKRVRDDTGRVRGNIYAQHDEPLGLRDAEYFDPGWLDIVAQACQHSNKTIRLTALSILNDIKQDKSMHHRHSRVALIESRLSAPQSPQALASRQTASLSGSETEFSHKSSDMAKNSPSSETELRDKSSNLAGKSPSSEAELSIDSPPTVSSSETEPSIKTRSYTRVRDPNCYVRSFTQCVKDTYVGSPEKNQYRLNWPSVIIENLSTVDRNSVEPQLQALPDCLGQQILDEVAKRVCAGEIKNLIAYLFATVKRARNGQFNTSAGKAKSARSPQYSQKIRPPQPVPPLEQPKRCRASKEYIDRVMAEIRAAYKQ